MKKFLALVFALLCMTTVFIGCTDKEEASMEKETEPTKITSLVGKWRERDVPGFRIKPNYEIEIKSDTISIYIITSNSQELPWVSEWYTRKLVWKGTYSDPEQPVVEYTFTSVGVDNFAPEHGGSSRTFSYSDDNLTFIRQNTEDETVPDPDNKVYLIRLDPSLDNSSESNNQ